ncbi:helix-turn-helix domain-containing protein [Actinomadura parmotrematis]|uniref:Helix-turn-helix transcriptional regulator n=1 Tax=Actinomadura parmotrematis TaxID=2864039 RepID=A0ABS7FPJ8_9ACTN|nr:helix-turn-helix transcriptional regulator [Actinomadura parmotrematis]MBW8482328.1 helix-turn-helix transcriptional regulator [Actinomadura parmotrematis]
MTNEPPDPCSSMYAWIAYSLRFQRVERGLSGDALAKILKHSRSTISRLESGEAKLTDKQAATLDREWRTGKFFTIALWFARLGHDPNRQASYFAFEARASMIRMFNGQYIPALFQTESVARAMLVAGRNDDIEGALAKRLTRQKLMERTPRPELWLIMPETVLWWPIGGAEVWREQLAHLLALAELPNVTLRIMPRTAGAHEGLDGTFKVISVQGGEVGFVEAPTGGRLVAEESEAQALRLRFERIGALALPVDSSRKLIVETLESL